jgi:hypothetical protein
LILNRQIVKLSNWWIDELMKWRIDELMNWWIDELMNWRIDELMNWRIDELTTRGRSRLMTKSSEANGSEGYTVWKETRKERVWRLKIIFELNWIELNWKYRCWSNSRIFPRSKSKDVIHYINCLRRWNGAKIIEFWWMKGL